MNKRQKKKRIKQWCKEHVRVVAVLDHHVVGYCAVIKEREHEI